jgi:hypothetical protein
LFIPVLKYPQIFLALRIFKQYQSPLTSDENNNVKNETYKISFGTFVTNSILTQNRQNLAVIAY